MKEFGPRGCIPGTPLDPPISTWVYKKIGTRNNNSNNSLLVACQNVPIRSIHTDFVVILSLIDWKEIMWELLCTVVGTYLTYLSPTCQPYVFRWPPLDVSTVRVGIHNPPEYTYPWVYLLSQVYLLFRYSYPFWVCLQLPAAANAPLGFKFFHFHVVFSKKRLAHPLWKLPFLLPALRSGKSWIRHYPGYAYCQIQYPLDM